MRVLRNEPAGWSPPAGGTAVTIGVFDGVHTGHREVIELLRRRAAAMGNLPTALVTFDPHPLAVIAPERAPRMLTTLEQRLEVLEDAGLDVVAVIPFDEGIRNLVPDDFVRLVLAEGLAARLVTVGEDFRFGRDRAGDVDALRRLGDHYGFEVDVADLLIEGDAVVSSTLIRHWVATGDVEEAARAMGRRFELRGTVVAGAHRGAGLGFPTANLAVSNEVILPARGVYAALAGIGGVAHPAVVNVGVRPTFDGTEVTIEAHLLGFDGDLYGQRMRLGFAGRIRDEMRFSGPDELVSRIRDDIDEARRLLHV
jgi:riboflavin kinase/FMN adenylyltransferase